MAGSGIFWHPYRLIPKQPLNARARDHAVARPGALIRRHGGYGCLHPWPELGQAPLEVHLASLAAGQPTEMAAQALHCCAVDGAARRAGVSLFANKTVPRSHATLTSRPTADQLGNLVSQGFTHAKLKVNGQDPAIWDWFPQMAAEFPLRWRLDCNGTVPTATVSQWLDRLAQIASKIDFVEDPTPYDAALWTRLTASCPIRLAADWHPTPVSAQSAAVRVLKPAAQAMEPPQLGQEQVITSLMDHPLGQCYAAWVAADSLPADAVCGLLTHPLYEPDAFIQALADENEPISPAFPVPSLAAPGLGFGELLAALPSWEELEDRT